MDARTLVAGVADDILKYADEADATRKLPDALMERLREAGLFRIYTPAEFGGMGLPLAEALGVVEEVSKFDGSTGWVVALGFSNDLFASTLPEDGARELLGDGSCLMAGSPGMNVRAVEVEGGYVITGRWPYASGAPNADWFDVMAPVWNEEGPVMAGEMPRMVMAHLKPDQATVLDTWDTTGLRGSGSHDLEADGAFVPKRLTGSGAITGMVAVRESVLARMPFMTLQAAIQSPAVCLGIARHAIEAFRTLAQEKERPPKPRLSEQQMTQVAIARGEGLVRSASSYFYRSVSRAWEQARDGVEITMDERLDVRMAALMAVENSVQTVDSLHRLAGAAVVFQSCELGRCWRDVHTAAQHMQVQEGRWETVGRVLFGLDPGHIVI